MEPVHLTDRAVLAVSGPEARDFLQGLITNDVTALGPGIGIYAALLSPQGKILFDFFLAEGDGALLIDCAATATDMLLKKLRLYKLRAKVEIEARDQLGVYAALPGEAAARAVSFADPRLDPSLDPSLAVLPARSIGAVAEMPRLAGPAAYEHVRLQAAVPEAADFGFEKIFALDAGLDELHGVAFDKGCYVGQELTARMKHRATARKRPYRISAEQALPPIGTPVTCGAVEIGEILSTYGRTGFALLRLDRLAEAQSSPAAACIPLALTRPAWLA